MFYVIGLGLSDEKDITIRGLEAVQGSTRVYLEAYTSILMVQKDRLEEFYGKQLIVADRDMVETESDDILRGADKEDVSLLVVGDPFGATTHTDIILRARSLKIPTRVIHNASIMNAVGACGLQLYNFGQTVSLVFFTDTWKPDSFYDRVKENSDLGMHTLILLDIKVKEQSEENLARGRKIYEPPRYMSIPQAVSQLLEIEELRQSGTLDADTTLAIAVSRVGGGEGNERIVAGTLSELRDQPETAFVFSQCMPGVVKAGVSSLRVTGPILRRPIMRTLFLADCPLLRCTVSIMSGSPKAVIILPDIPTRSHSGF